METLAKKPEDTKKSVWVVKNLESSEYFTNIQATLQGDNVISKVLWHKDIHYALNWPTKSEAQCYMWAFIPETIKSEVEEYEPRPIKAAPTGTKTARKPRAKRSRT